MTPKLKQLYFTICSLLLISLFVKCSEPIHLEADNTPKQFLLLNKHFVSDKSNGAADATMGFCAFDLAEGLPYNWAYPTAFNQGKVYNRMKIYSKPSNELIQCQIGFQWSNGCDSHPFKEKFPDFSICQFTTATEIEWVTASIPDWWEPDCQKNYDPIDWTSRVERLLLVFRDKNNYPIDDRWGADKGWDLSLYFPMEVHIQSVMVPLNEQFKGWEAYPEFDKTPLLSTNLKQADELKLFVFPNPCHVNQTVQITFGNPVRNIQILVTDLSGRVVFAKSITESLEVCSINLPNIAIGSYVISATAGDFYSSCSLVIQ